MSNKNDILHLLSAYGNMRRHLSLEFSQNLKPLKMGSKQAAILYQLVTNGDQSLTSLSRATLSDPAAITRAVQTMVKKGWVKKEEMATDQRQTLLRMTHAGEKLANQMRSILVATMENICADLSEKETHTLTALLNKIGSKG